MNTEEVRIAVVCVRINEWRPGQQRGAFSIGAATLNSSLEQAHPTENPESTFSVEAVASGEGPSQEQAAERFATWCRIQRCTLLGGYDVERSVEFLRPLINPWPFIERIVDLHSLAYVVTGMSMDDAMLAENLGYTAKRPESIVYLALWHRRSMLRVLRYISRE